MFWRYRRNNWFILMLTFKIKPNLSFSILFYFFFWIWENSTSQKAHFVGPGERVKPRLFQTLTRDARLTRTRDLLCKSQALCHHAMSIEDSIFLYINSIPLFLNWLVLSKFIFNYVTKKIKDGVDSILFYLKRYHCFFHNRNFKLITKHHKILIRFILN